MTEQFIHFGNGYIYQLDTTKKTLLFLEDGIFYGGDIPVDIQPYPEADVESFLKNNPEYRIIEGMEE